MEAEFVIRHPAADSAIRSASDRNTLRHSEEMVREGKLRALAMTSMTRSSVIPQVPTVTEFGYSNFEATNWYGLLAAARTPVAIIDKLHAETVKGLALPELLAKLSELGVEVIGNSPEGLHGCDQAALPKLSRFAARADAKPARDAVHQSASVRHP